MTTIRFPLKTGSGPQSPVLSFHSPSVGETPRATPTFFVPRNSLVSKRHLLFSPSSPLSSPADFEDCLRRLDRGERLSWERIDLKLARLHYEGRDIVPGVQSDLREKAIELTTELLGGDEGARIRARRLDLAYALAVSASLEGNGRHVPNGELMEKLDVSDWCDQIPTMRDNVTTVLERGRGAEPHILSRLGDLKRELAQAWQACGQGEGLGYEQWMGLMQQYAVDVGSFDGDGYYRGASQDKESFDRDHRQISYGSVLFPTILLNPSFEKIDLKNYAEKILACWPTGEHPVTLSEAFETHDFDGRKGRLGRTLSAHDPFHSELWTDALAIRADLYWNPSNPTLMLCALLEIKVSEMQRQLSFRRACQGVANPRVLEWARLWCFHFNHEGHLADLPTLREQGLDHALWAHRASPDLRVEDYLSSGGNALIGVFYKNFQENGYGDLLSDPIQALSFEEYLASIRVMLAADENGA